MTFDSPQLIPGITGVVLTKNGERLIDKCLASLAFCDTLLVVDSGSTDATLKIAERYNAEIFFNEWRGFDVQFTFAHGRVRTRWLFIVDQDEICPAPLGKAIIAAVAKADAQAETTENSPVAFSVGRKSWYFDRFMRHGGWYPDPILRVFRSGLVEFSQEAHIHYTPLGRSEHVGGPGAELVHYPYNGFEHQMAKLNLYAQQGADALRAKGGRGGLLIGVGHGFFRFIRIYFLKAGFLDGKAGFLAACHGAFYAFLKYIRVLDASWGAPYDDN